MRTLIWPPARPRGTNLATPTCGRRELRTYDIPLVAPMIEGKLQETVDPSVRKGTFKGIVNHYHIDNELRRYSEVIS